MAFGGQMDDAVHMILFHQGIDGIKIADVCFDEGVVGLVLYILEIGQITGISQFVKIDDMVVGVFVDKESDYMTADKTGSTGDDYVSFKIHCFAVLMYLLIS